MKNLPVILMSFCLIGENGHCFQGCVSPRYCSLECFSAALGGFLTSSLARTLPQARLSSTGPSSPICWPIVPSDSQLCEPATCCLVSLLLNWETSITKSKIRRNRKPSNTFSSQEKKIRKHDEINTKGNEEDDNLVTSPFGSLATYGLGEAGENTCFLKRTEYFETWNSFNSCRVCSLPATF